MIKYKILIREDNKLWSLGKAFATRPEFVLEYKENEVIKPKEGHNPFLFVFDRLEDVNTHLKGGCVADKVNVEIWEVEAEEVHIYTTFNRRVYVASRYLIGTQFCTQLKLIKRVDVVPAMGT